MKQGITVQDLNDIISNATGCDHYVKITPFTKTVATDTVIDFCNKAQCHWILSDLAIAAMLQKVRREEFQVWKFSKKTMKLTIEDGNGNTVYKQNVDTTDFPLDELELFHENNVVCFPSER